MWWKDFGREVPNPYEPENPEAEVEALLKEKLYQVESQHDPRKNYDPSS